MIKNQRPIRLLLITLLIVGIIITLVMRRAPRKAVPVREPVLVLPAPTIHLQSPKNVSFQFEKEPVIPSQLTTYLYEEYSLAETERLIRNSLSSYAIPASASSLVRMGVSTTTWSRLGAEFILTSSPTTTSVVFRQQQALSLPGTISPSVAVARQFIFQLFSLPTGMTLTNLGAKDGEFDGLFIIDTFPKTEFVAELFSYAVEGRPVISLYETGPNATVVVDGNGVVRAATVFPPPKQLVPGASMPLITKADVLSNLTQGRGAIVSGYNEATSGQGEQLTFTSFGIKEVSVVYAKQGTAILPAFLLSGTGTDAGGQIQEATYFLWAFAAPKKTTQP